MSFEKPITIRQATAEDAPGILNCLREAFEPYRASYTLEAFRDLRAFRILENLRAGHFVQTPREPLDDATTQRLDNLADRAARIFSLTAGLLFLIGGVAGFVMMWLYSHRPVARTSSSYEFANFRLVTLLSVGCGLAVLLGLVILREIFKKSGTAWLVPLRVFTLIVSRRAPWNNQRACARTLKTYTECWNCLAAACGGLRTTGDYS